jgi:hypothetical protein
MRFNGFVPKNYPPWLTKSNPRKRNSSSAFFLEIIGAAQIRAARGPTYQDKRCMGVRGINAVEPHRCFPCESLGMYCLNAKSSEERVVYKKLNSTGTLIERTTTEAPQGHMYYIGLDVHRKTIS